MVGQNELLIKLHSYNISTLPTSLLFIGEDGCGKHTLANELSIFLSTPLYDITDKLSYELISEIQLQSLDALYLINLSSLTEREQNIILKFLEEPSIYAHLILISNTKVGILDTILNRCMIYTFDLYSEEELKTFLQSDDTLVLKYCRTPGQVLNLNNNIDKLEVLCDTIVHKLNIARFDNALSIVNKMNYKDYYDKFDVNLFFRVLLTKLFNEYIINKSDATLKLYNIVKEYYTKLQDIRINREILIENMIITMWKSVR